jgi:hypothetical protein
MSIERTKGTSDPIVEAMIRIMSGGKLGDPSSTVMDPIAGILAGTYRPETKATEADLYSIFAPTLLQAGAEGENSPRAIAASRIRNGESPWDVIGDKNLRGGIREKDWKKFVETISKEDFKVRSEMSKQQMEPDVFQKGGLPSMEEKWSPEGLYKIAPKQYGKVLSGIREAMQAQEDMEKQLVQQYLKRGDGSFKGEEARGQIQKEIETELNRWASDKGARPDSINKSVVPSPTLLRGSDWLNKSPSEKRAIIKNNAEERIKLLGGDRNPAGFVYETPGRKIDAEARARAIAAANAGRPGGAGFKMREADELTKKLSSQLEEAGITPLMDAILRTAAIRSRMKNG